MEEGFRSASDYESDGLPGCVSLVNSVSSAETSRINYYLKNEVGSAQARAAAKRERAADLRGDKEKAIKKGIVHIPSGQILVCKIFL